MYGAFSVNDLPQGAYLFFSSVSLFDLTARFFAPTRSFLWPSRTGAVRAGRLFGGHRRLGLDGFEHDATLDAVGMTIRGETAFGRDQSRHNLVFGGCKNPTMMQPCASAAKLRDGGPILPLGMTAMSHLGTPPPRTVIGDPVTSGRTEPKLLGAFSVLRS